MVNTGEQCKQWWWLQHDDNDNKHKYYSDIIHDDDNDSDEENTSVPLIYNMQFGLQCMHDLSKHQTVIIFIITTSLTWGYQHTEINKNALEH